MDSLPHHTLKSEGRANAINVAPILPATGAEDAIDLRFTTPGAERRRQPGQSLLAVRAEEAPYFSAADTPPGEKSVGY